MIKLYNSLSGKKEEFRPLEEGKVKMYACGITVSGDAHVGHAYQALIYDIVRKVFEKAGYDVTYARNYTDVDDKIIAKANQLGVPADRYAAEMIVKTNAIMRELEIDEPTIWLKATENIDGIIEFTKKLIEKGHAYATENGDVYFSVDSFPEYGKLSKRNLKDAIAGVRKETEKSKRNPLDFALWKSAKEGEISWSSPWGEGRPGWHIECSTMNFAAFGEQIDIHGGGRDLIFPHHENEIAQTEALTGKQFAKYWMHNGLIKVNGQKMSKSLGNTLNLRDLLDKFSPETIKLALLSTNYRGDINITDNLFSDAEKHMTDFYRVLQKAEAFGKVEPAEDIEEEFDRAMQDDFNTALALGNLFGYFKKARALLDKGDVEGARICEAIKRAYSMLGLFKKSPKEFLKKIEEKNSVEIPMEIMELVEKRAQFKKERNFAAADEIRNQIENMGYSVMDTKDGPVVSKK